MIDALALRIATGIKNANPEKTTSIDIMQFALIILINGFIIFFLSITVGIWTGKGIETVLFLLSFIGLRFTTGGFHLDSSMKCTIVSCIIAIGFPQLPVTASLVPVFGVLSLLLILVFAPANIEGHTRIPPRYYPLLKALACLVVASNFFIQNPTLALGFFIQSLTLIHIPERR